MRAIEDITSSHKYVEDQLDRKLEALCEHLDSDVITIVAAMIPGVENAVREQIEQIEGNGDLRARRQRLAVILETSGGSIEVVERIAALTRHHYPDNVAFYIPDHAMSAGTVLAMSGNSIHMDYFSVLGPIDPQVRLTPNSPFLPALGYLEKYDELIAKSSKGELTDAELSFLIQKFDPAELHLFEQARDLSIELLRAWLVKYQFPMIEDSKGGKQPLTPQARGAKATVIATKLNDVRRWKTHGRGLSRSVIEAEVGLKIEDFGADHDLNKILRGYYQLLQDYMVTASHTMVFHASSGYRGI